MNEKFAISNLVIEVTRRCNMSCEHCLRGNAQNVDMPLEYIDTAMSRLTDISQLTITGGEPSLVPDRIEYIVDSARRNKVSIGNFYIATNAKHVTNEFLISLVRLHCYCYDNEYSAVNWSNDEYHDEQTEENIRRLSVFSFASARYNKYVSSVTAEGRAKDWGERENKAYFSSFEDHVYMDNRSITEGEIYVNCRGKIVYGCDWSYRSQTRKKNVICSIEDFSFDSIVDYFRKHCKD